MPKESRSERYARKEDFREILRIVEKLMHLITRLRSGTAESARELGDGVAELLEGVERLKPIRPQESPGSRLATKKIVAMARRGELSGRVLPPGRARFEDFVAGIIQKHGETPPPRPSPFRLTPVGQRRSLPPIDEGEVRRALEAWRKGLIKKSMIPSNRGPAPERAAASEALEKNLLERIGEQRRRRRDLFGRPTG